MDLSAQNKRQGFMISGALVYELAFIYCVTVAFLQTTLFTAFFGIRFFHYLLMPGLALVLFKMFFLDQDKSVWRFVLNVTILGILVLTWRTSSDFSMLTMGTFILGAREVNFRRLVKEYLVVGTVTLLIVICASQFGIIKNLIYFRTGTHIYRQSFGTVYPTDFAAHVLYLILSYVYLRFHRISLFSYLFMFIAAAFVFYFCNARFDALALLIMIPVIMIGQRASNNNQLSRLVACTYWIVPVLMAYLTIVLAYFFDKENTIFMDINKALSGRLALSHKAFSEYGVSLFGKHVIEHGWGGATGFHMFLNNPSHYFYVDSAYIRGLIFYGVIVAFLILAVMTFISWRSVVDNDFALASILVIISLSAVIEQHLFDLGYDPFLLAVFADVYGVSKLKKGDKS